MDGESKLEEYRRKANQAWEMAGLARMDGDSKDALRWTKESQRLDALAKEEADL